jgi:hypothetical protein
MSAGGLAGKDRNNFSRKKGPDCVSAAGFIDRVYSDVWSSEPFDRLARVVFGAVFDRLLINVEMNQAFGPIDLTHRPERNQNPLARPPIFGVGDEVVDAPIRAPHKIDRQAAIFRQI